MSNKLDRDGNELLAMPRNTDVPPTERCAYIYRESDTRCDTQFWLHKDVTRTEQRRHQFVPPPKLPDAPPTDAFEALPYPTDTVYRQYYDSGYDAARKQDEQREARLREQDDALLQRCLPFLVPLHSAANLEDDIRKRLDSVK